MRFLFLIHGDENADARLSDDERRAIVSAHMEYGAMLRERGSTSSARRSQGRRRRPSSARAIRLS